MCYCNVLADSNISINLIMINDFKFILIIVYIQGVPQKKYLIFVLFISPVKIEIFQVCLFHIIGKFVFHPNFFSWISTELWVHGKKLNE